MSVPPGVSERDFERALARFRSVVGADWVFTSDEDVALYRDAYSPLWSEPEEKVASAAIGPESAEQVQEIVRIANEFRIPLYPISTGRNLGYGGSAPVLSGSVVLDLKRMNRILEVDERNAYALVEPGVSYFDLYRHIEERGLKLWIDCPDPGWGSIVGNALDHGVGYTMNPYRDHWGAQCGLEVVTGDGELVRTGMGALPGSRTWQQFKYGYGPYLDGMFSQSNFGVVTKMGVWLMPQPEAYVDCSVDVFAPRRHHPARRSHELRDEHGAAERGHEPAIAAALRRGRQSRAARRARERSRGGHREARRVLARAPGAVLLERVQVLRARGSRARADGVHAPAPARRFPARGFARGRSTAFPITAEQKAAVRDPQDLGIPTLETFSIGARSNFAPATRGHLGFSPVIPMRGEAVIESQRVFQRVLQEFGTDVALLVFPQSYHPRTFVILCMFYVMPDPASNQAVRRTFERLVEVAAEHGWGEYRTHTAFMDECAAAYSFNDHALRKLQEKIKDAVDPNGILSAGRYGIWPKHLRDV